MKNDSILGIWSAINWILIILMFVTDIQLPGVQLYQILLISILLRFLVTTIYYQRNQTSPHSSQASIYPNTSNDQPSCPNCGVVGIRNARFCEQCGTPMDSEIDTEQFR